MAKGQGQKRKLLVLERILKERTDEDHPITMDQIMNELARWDVSAERKSIYSDMEELRRCGVDVQVNRGRGGGWFIGDRDFQLAELKMLVDTVQSSRFLTRKKSDELIGKLEKLTSVHQARQLGRQVYVSGQVKTMNESIYYNVDRLHSAIAADRVITFRYFVYDRKRKRCSATVGRSIAYPPADWFGTTKTIIWWHGPFGMKRCAITGWTRCPISR